MSSNRELINRMRTEFLNDTEGAVESDYKWSTANLASALNSAQNELSKRLLLLYDSTTESVCRIAVTAVAGVYPQSVALSDKILRVQRLRFPGVARPLEQMTMERMDQMYPYWESEKGTPDAFMVDLDNFTITFNRQPTAGGVVSLAVKRLPLADITENSLTASPEIRQMDDEMIHGALKYAYLKDDLETFDPVRSGVWSKVFESDIAQIVRNRAAFNPADTVCRAERF